MELIVLGLIVAVFAFVGISMFVARATGCGVCCGVARGSARARMKLNGSFNTPIVTIHTDCADFRR